MSEPVVSGVSEKVVGAVAQRLFSDPSLNTFAILDGAAIPGLLPKLEEEAPEHACLYRGELEPDLAECAPYLVQLKAGSAFARWVLTEGWGNNWGIFALVATDLATLRRHFRGFLLIMSPEGKRLYFRYYDPRVLRVFLPTCAADQLRTIFGPIVQYGCEAERMVELISFGFEGGKLGVKHLPLEGNTQPPI